MFFDELAELSGQRNAIDGQIVDLVAEIEHDNLCGMTGCRSVAALVAWKVGVSPSNAATVATIAHRFEQFPRLAAGMREGRLSLDRVGVIAERAADGSDEHYVELAESGDGVAVADGGEVGAASGSRAEAGAQAVDLQDVGREVHDVSDHVADFGGGEVRCGAGLASRRADGGVETRPRYDRRR